MITGLYQYARGGVVNPPKITLSEIPVSLATNESYRNDLLILAGDDASAAQLKDFGLHVYRVFSDAPAFIQHDAAHKMKHWMCRWALEEFGEFLWVDWDTVLLRRPDENFWNWCRQHRTPKFIYIPDYWATINCGVYYAGKEWSDAMERSFHASVSEPNDELLWLSELPENVLDRAEFWWGKRVVQVWNREDFCLAGPDTYFAHIRHLEWANDLRAAVAVSMR